MRPARGSASAGRRTGTAPCRRAGVTSWRALSSSQTACAVALPRRPGGDDPPGAVVAPVGVPGDLLDVDAVLAQPGVDHLGQRGARSAGLEPGAAGVLGEHGPLLQHRAGVAQHPVDRHAGDAGHVLGGLAGADAGLDVAGRQRRRLGPGIAAARGWPRSARSAAVTRSSMGSASRRPTSSASTSAWPSSERATKRTGRIAYLPSARRESAPTTLPRPRRVSAAMPGRPRRDIAGSPRLVRPVHASPRRLTARY